MGDQTGRKFVLGVLGGSGLYELPGLNDIRERRVETPYGEPSDAIVEGTLGTPSGPVRLLFLPRHGRGHVIAPHMINYRANICALKTLGATHLLSVSAVGSMREDIAPGDVVAVDQFIDWTKRRVSTFFDEGIVAHVGFADPVCAELKNALFDAAVHARTIRGDPSNKAAVHDGGTYLCIDGPQFSTRAESRLYRSWGVSVIGMTGMPEAKLAREAELPFAMLALATDYDCWHETEVEVSVNAVIAVLKENVEFARGILGGLARRLPNPASSCALGALKQTVLTQPLHMSRVTRERLSWLLGPA